MLKLKIIMIVMTITTGLFLPACSSVSQSVTSISNNAGPTVVLYQYEAYHQNHKNPEPQFLDQNTVRLTGTVMSNEITDNTPSIAVDNDRLVLRMKQPNELRMEKLIFWYDQHTRPDLKQAMPDNPCTLEFTPDRLFISIKPGKP